MGLERGKAGAASVAAVCSLQNQEHALPEHQHLLLVVVFHEQALRGPPATYFAPNVNCPRVLRSHAERLPIDTQLPQRIVVRGVLVLKRRRATNFFAYLRQTNVKTNADADQSVEFRHRLNCWTSLGESIGNNLPGAKRR